MKISCTGLDIQEGKVKYNDSRLEALKNKFNPKKFEPFYFEILKDKFIKAEAIAILKEDILDLLIVDIEKAERRLQNSDDSFEKELMKKAIKYLEEEIPLCDGEFDKKEQDKLRAISMASIKPVKIFKETPSLTRLIEEILKKAKKIFFYTAGPNEVHAWFIDEGATIVECAAKIHSDLAKGFVKGDVLSFDDLMESHNFNDARKKGLVKLVDRDHIIKSGDVIEIRSGL